MRILYYPKEWYISKVSVKLTLIDQREGGYSLSLLAQKDLPVDLVKPIYIERLRMYENLIENAQEESHRLGYYYILEHKPNLPESIGSGAFYLRVMDPYIKMYYSVFVTMFSSPKTIEFYNPDLSAVIKQLVIVEKGSKELKELAEKLK